jgi:hypothetical protein
MSSTNSARYEILSSGVTLSFRYVREVWNDAVQLTRAADLQTARLGASRVSAAAQESFDHTKRQEIRRRRRQDRHHDIVAGNIVLRFCRLEQAASAKSIESACDPQARRAHMPLMEFYLYPPKYISSAVIATLAPPAGRPHAEAGTYRASNPDFGYLDALQASIGGAASPRHRALRLKSPRWPANPARIDSARATTRRTKIYYFYISFSHKRHRFFTSIWRMLPLLGSWRHRSGV